MNGTLISQPPGGGGSGSSVTNGGPACAESNITSAPMTNVMRWSFNERRTSDRLFDLITTNLSSLRTAVRNTDKESVSFRHEQSAARAIRRIDFSQSFVGVCVSLIDNVDLARAANHVNAMMLTVIKNIIGVTRDSNARNWLAGGCIEHDELSWESASDKPSVIGLIECHRKISKGAISFPRCNYFAFVAIYD